eukprot:s12314_g1.t1
MWDEARVPGRKECRKIYDRLVKQAPDVILINPPTGPFSSWTQASPKELREQKARYWPLWDMIVKVWEKQNRRGRLVYLQMPQGARVPGVEDLREMKMNYERSNYGDEEASSTRNELGRNQVFETKVDLCMFEHRDPESRKLFKKAV